MGLWDCGTLGLGLVRDFTVIPDFYRLFLYAPAYYFALALKALFAVFSVFINH